MTDTTGVVKLACPNHHDVLVKGLWYFFQHEHAVDFDLEFGEGRPVRAHRLILEVFLTPDDIGAISTAAKNYTGLKTAVDSESNPSGKWSREGELHSTLLEFLYTGTVDVKQERLDDLLQLATVLNFKLLADAIENSKRDTGGLDLLVSDLEEGRNAPRKQVKRRKPRKSTPRKARAVVPVSTTDDGLNAGPEVAENEGEGHSTARRKMPRRSAKDVAIETMDADMMDEIDGVVEDPVDESEPSSNSRRNRTRRFGCPQCSYKSYNRYQMKMHVARHDANSLFRCKSCANVYLTADALARHQRRIHANDPSTWRCTLCEVVLRTSSNLRIHRRVAHGLDTAGRPVQRKFECEHGDCQESFVYKSQLDLHVATKHTGLRPFRCPDCTYSAFTMSDLKKHIKFKHAHERPHVCEICGFSTVTTSNMSKHRRTHTKEKPFVCECGKAYADKASLRDHAIRHEEGYSDEKARTHMCHVCGKGFLTRNHLMEHLRKVHRGRPSSPTSSTPDKPKAQPALQPQISPSTSAVKPKEEEFMQIEPLLVPESIVPPWAWPH